MIRQLLALPLIVLILGYSSDNLAEETADQTERKYYDVEIIVFKNNLVAKGREFNLPTPSASPTENTVDLSNPDSFKQTQELGFTPLPLEQLRLQDMVQRIVRSSRYDLLVHTGWRQPGLGAENSIPVWIKGGDIFGKSYSSIDQVMPAQNNQATTSDTKADSTAARPPSDGLYELEGLITVSLSRYLHTKAELVLRKPAKPMDMIQQPVSVTEDQRENLDIESLEGQLLLNYELNEQRRMRSKRLHYLDHPEFGLLVLITPYETEEPEQEQTAESLPVTAEPTSNPAQ